MDRRFGTYEPYVYALLRIVVGFLFACHGVQKGVNLLGGAPGASPLTGILPWLAGLIELLSGVLVAVGLFTGWAAFLASGEMAVAYFMVHAPRAPLPIENGGEPAVLFCFAFLFMAFRGDGPFSVARAVANATKRS